MKKQYGILSIVCVLVYVCKEYVHWVANAQVVHKEIPNKVVLVVAFWKGA